MGFFDSIKNLFSSQKEIEPGKISVKIDELEKWIKENSPEKEKRINFVTDETYKELNKIIDQAKADLNELREYEIRKTDERIVAVVKQEREIYVDFVKEFLQEIFENENREITQFLAYYYRRSALFSKQSFRSFHVTSELIGKPLEKLLNDFREIEVCIKKFNDLLKNEVSKLNSLTKSAYEINQFVLLKKENEENISKITLSTDAINAWIIKLKENDESLKKSKEFIQKEELKKEATGVLQDIQSKKGVIILAFDKIKKGLKKFERIEQNKSKKELISKLAEDTFDTLKTTNGQVNSLLDQLIEKTKKEEIESSLEDIENARNSLKILAEIEELNSKSEDLKKKEDSIRLEWNNEKIKELEEEINKNSKLKENYLKKMNELTASINNLKREIPGKTTEYLGKQIEITD